MTLQTSLAKLGTISDLRAWESMQTSDPRVTEVIREIVQKGGDESTVYHAMRLHSGNDEFAQYCRTLVRGLLVELRKVG